MSDDLISRKELINNIRKVIHERGLFHACSGREVSSLIMCEIDNIPSAFDKEKVIEELKAWEKASHDAGIQSKYAGLDGKASEYYQESRAYHKAIEIVEEGGIE